jgi:phosphoserine phosphatase
MSIKLTETQQLLLSAAAKRDDRCIVVPSGPKGAAAKIAAKLAAAGLVGRKRKWLFGGATRRRAEPILLY